MANILDMPNTLITRRLGTCDYKQTWQNMRLFTECRSDQNCDEVWLLEHPHVFTQGKAGKKEHLLATGNVPVIQTDRGGQVTYHGPGQLIIYTLINLRRAKLGAKKFVSLLEKSIIDTLAEYEIKAQSRDDAPGVYLTENGAKICSLGLRIHKGCSYHGLALNVATHLKYFNCINPCGFKNLAMANIKDFVPNINTYKERKELEKKVMRNLTKNFGYEKCVDEIDDAFEEIIRLIPVPDLDD